MKDKNMKMMVEIPKDSKQKFEIKDGKLFLDRSLLLSVPYNYGFLENTLADDGDPLDAFLVTSFPLPPGTSVECEVLFGYNCIDSGKNDQKLVLVPSYKNLDAINHDIVDAQISFFLKNYKKDFILLSKINKQECLDLYKKTKKITIKSILKKFL